MQVTAPDNIRRKLDNQDTTVHTSEFQTMLIAIQKINRVKKLNCSWVG